MYADLLAKLGKSHHSPTTDESDESGDIHNLAEPQGVEWHAGRDSNPRPSGSKTEGGARSNAYLQLQPCKRLQQAALDCT